ncbi:lycopene cyclase family protein [Actinophytocola glycyrrhizae]|uniref:Lycopene cyclase family protein n=1 Tax=Actinophytocola glycyrrhizae TaxID=2044873 RepID=A0ABV9S746_9PSEU
MVADVVVAGGGPSGWALASACARRGLAVTLVAPGHRWRATYGLWADEVSVLPPGSRWVTTRVRGGGLVLPRAYAVLDNDSVLAACAHPGIEVVRARVTALTATSAALTTGEVCHGMVFDATGARRGGAEQTAYGVVVEEQHEAVFMDWTPPPGHIDGPATFLYAVPLPDGRMLLEETCLAGAPGLGFAELRDRLHARVGEVTGPVERVRFPVDVPPPPQRGRGAVPFGAAAGLVHPATGFSVADAFRLAPAVADTIGRGRRAVRRVIWPWRARLVYRLRRRGLATLLNLTTAEHEEFFDLFFALPARHQRAYLSGRADPAGTAAAMAALFRAAPPHLRRKMTAP